MHLILSTTLLPQLKKALKRAHPTAGSCNLSEAIAAGLGFGTYAGLLEALKSDNEGIVWRPLSEPAFGARLHALSEVGASPEALLAAAVRSIPDNLLPQNQAEGALIATVHALKRAKRKMELEAEERRFDRVISPPSYLYGATHEPLAPVIRAFGLRLMHNDRNSFTADAVLREAPGEPTDIPFWSDSATIAGLLDFDLACIRKVLTSHDSARIAPASEEEERRRIQGTPIYEIGAFAKGCNIEILPYLHTKRVGIQVWRDALAVTVLDKVGNYEHRVIFLIDSEHFELIERAMCNLRLSYVATPDAVMAIGDALRTRLYGRVPRIVADW